MLKSTTAIVLSAGLSSRMGQFKGALPFRHHTILQEVITNIAATDVHEIVVVTGRYHEETLALVSNFSNCKTVFNEEYSSGLMSSIKQGISSITHKSTDFLICLGDMPFIKSETFQSIIDLSNSLSQEDSYIIRPFFENNSGHPVLFSRHFNEELLKNTNLKGANNIIMTNSKSLHMLDVQDRGVLIDIDTMVQYNTIRGNDWGVV